MTINCPLSLAVAAAVALAALAQAQDAHKTVTAQEIKWGPAPSSIPPGAQAAVLCGDPGKEGMFSLRLKLPKDYANPPHTHPKLEIVTVISGTFPLGMGEKGRQEQGSSPAGGQFLSPSSRHGPLRFCGRGHGDPAQQHGSVGPHLR